MNIILNGMTQKLEDGMTVADIVALLELEGKRIAVEVNETIVPRSQHETHTVAEGDNVEIIHAIGGG